MKNKSSSQTAGRPLRIALDVSQMAYASTGVGRYTEELVRALLSLNTSTRFSLYAGTLRQSGFFRLRARQKPWSRARWRLSPLSPRLAPLFWNLTNLPLETFVGSQDIIHTSDWTEPRTLAPSVTTVHDLVFRRYPATLPASILRTQKARLARVVKYSTHIIADSQHTKADLIRDYALPSARITVIYPGVDSSFSPQKSASITRVREHYHLPPRYLLTLSTREPRKNLPRLLKAYQRLRTHDSDFPALVIAGRHGWGKPLASLPPGVFSTGYVARRHLAALYSGASAFLYPSLYEGFGFPVLEAMACGTPVVTSNTSSLPEVAGEAGILVNPLQVASLAAGITRVLRERESRRVLSLKQARRFTWKHTAQATFRLYQQVYQTTIST